VQADHRHRVARRRSLTGRPNFLYVRVENLGPHAARHVIVEARLTPNLGNPFIYPADWTSIDDQHIRAKSLHNVFPHVPAGGSVIARFEITEEQSDALASWLRTQNAQPTLLALVMAENDYSFAAAPIGPNLVLARNNLAQRNLVLVVERRRREEREAEIERNEHGSAVELTLNIKVRGQEAEIEVPARRRR
jgi:hypothetical protein